MAEQDSGGPIVQLALSVASLAEQMVKLTEGQARIERCLQSIAEGMDEGAEVGAEPATYLSGKPR